MEEKGYRFLPQAYGDGEKPQAEPPIEEHCPLCGSTVQTEEDGWVDGCPNCGWRWSRIPDTPCPCCGEKTIPNGGDAVAFICPNCFWEIDPFIQGEEDSSDLNHGLTLRQARQNRKDRL